MAKEGEVRRRRRRGKQRAKIGSQGKEPRARPRRNTKRVLESNVKDTNSFQAAGASPTAPPIDGVLNDVELVMWTIESEKLSRAGGWGSWLGRRWPRQESLDGRICAEILLLLGTYCIWLSRFSPIWACFGIGLIDTYGVVITFRLEVKVIMFCLEVKANIQVLCWWARRVSSGLALLLPG